MVTQLMCQLTLPLHMRLKQILILTLSRIKTALDVKYTLNFMENTVYTVLATAKFTSFFNNLRLRFRSFASSFLKICAFVLENVRLVFFSFFASSFFFAFFCVLVFFLRFSFLLFLRSHVNGCRGR